MAEKSKIDKRFRIPYCDILLYYFVQYFVIQGRLI